MKKERAENKITKHINVLKKDYVLRTFIFSTLSFFVNVIFMGYNIVLSIVYKSAWNIGISVYYALLAVIRAYVLFYERKLYKLNVDDEQKDVARKKMFFVQSVFLFIIDVALIAPISIMVLQKKEIHYTIIPAIAMAGYTTYKIISAGINYKKTRKQQHLSIRILKNINFIDALVSVLTLQYTLIMTFGKGINGSMLTLCAISSFALWSLIIVVSVLSVIEAIKLKRR